MHTTVPDSSSIHQYELRKASLAQRVGLLCQRTTSLHATVHPLPYLHQPRKLAEDISLGSWQSSGVA